MENSTHGNFTDFPETTEVEGVYFNFSLRVFEFEKERWLNETGGVCDVQSSEALTRNLLFTSIIYTVYGIIFFIAFTGNVIVCYIVLSSPRMKTVTNYFILNLAVGDLLVTLLCVPFTVDSMLRQYWVFPEFLCPVVCYVSALSVFVSAYTLVAISIDKYMLIMWPLKPRISKKFATCIIGLIWLIAGTTALPTGIFSTLIQPYAEPGWHFSKYELCDKYICQEDYSRVGAEWHSRYTTVLMNLQYIVPSVVLLYTYTRIGIVVWWHKIPGEAENVRDKRMARSKRKMIKMMVTVVVVYTMCWLPFNVLLKIIHHPNLIPRNWLPYLYFGLHALAMSHSCYNPIIYCNMNGRFRDGLCAILQIFPCLRARISRKATNSSYSGQPNNNVLAKHAALESTNSASSLQRNNTNSTYVSISGKKNRLSTTCQPQAPVRSASLMRHSQQTGNNGKSFATRSMRSRSTKDFSDLQI